MNEHWYNARLYLNQESTSVFAEKIFNTTGSKSPGKLNVFVKGTNFQLKVWEALLKIPMGTVTTYQGSAVGANHIAYLIPCHRVIRKDGILGPYRWSSTRKKSIIGWEQAKTASLGNY